MIAPKRLALLLLLMPGIAAIGFSSYFLFADWDALTRSQRNYAKLASEGAGLRELSIAQSAEMRHRINCFAEGVGVLLGGVIFASSFRCARGNGVHGLCTSQHR